ncbi:MAG: hypothetical protein JW803_08070 [Endomicrobiales bacterium]|nr:hypothetical protein [Endomicrobiales bacterium]
MFRKSFVALIALGVTCLVGFVVPAMADSTNPHNFYITIQCNRVVAVDISTGPAQGHSTGNYPAVEYGLVATSATLVANTTLYIWNTSAQNTAAIQNYGLNAAMYGFPVSTWTLNTASWACGENTCSLAAIFRDSFPADSGEFAGDTDLVTGSVQYWNATIFNPESSGAYDNNPTTEPNVGAHSRGDDPAQLYICLKTPAAIDSAGANTQVIQVVVTAQ